MCVHNGPSWLVLIGKKDTTILGLSRAVLLFSVKFKTHLAHLGTKTNACSQAFPLVISSWWVHNSHLECGGVGLLTFPVRHKERWKSKGETVDDSKHESMRFTNSHATLSKGKGREGYSPHHYITQTFIDSHAMASPHNTFSSPHPRNRKGMMKLTPFFVTRRQIAHATPTTT